MKKKVPHAGIVWGIILLHRALDGLLGSIMFAYANPNSEALGILIAYTLLFFLLGTTVLLLGLDSRKKVIEYNQQIIDKDLIATCFCCKQKIIVNSSKFKPHKLYPNGFIYCPVCHTPLNRCLFIENDFDSVRSGGGIKSNDCSM